MYSALLFKNCHDKAPHPTTCEGKSFIWIILPNHRPYEGRAWQELKAGNWRQEVMQKSWKNPANWLVQLAFLYNSGPPVQY